MNSTRLLLPLTLLLSAPLHAGDIAWKGDLREVKREAAASNQVVFVAINMDGERANDRMVKDVYTNKRIVELSAQTLNLVASNSTHASDGKTCPRFGVVTCEAHRHVDADVRAEVLKPDEEGFVVAPQHVFLGPDGSVILSVPYEVVAEELEWCFVTAMRSVNPKSELKLSAKARAPKRLILGDVFSVGAESLKAPLTREAALELISELKKGLIRGEELQNSLRRLAMADEPEAREYILGVLRTVSGGGGRGGGGGGGAGPGGGGGGAAAARGQGNDRRPLFLHWIGANSPTSYWEVCIEFIDENDLPMRAEAIVALEQLGARDSLKGVLARLRKEKEERFAKNLLRAVGTCGGDDKNARKTLLKQAGSDRHPILQANAIIALGWLTRDDEVNEFLLECQTSKEERVRLSAILAMAISRNEAWKEVLTAELEKEPEARIKEALESALVVLNGGALKTVEDLVTRVATDELKRERIFGASRPTEDKERE